MPPYPQSVPYLKIVSSDIYERPINQLGFSGEEYQKDPRYRKGPHSIYRTNAIQVRDLSASGCRTKKRRPSIPGVREHTMGKGNAAGFAAQVWSVHQRLRDIMSCKPPPFSKFVNPNCLRIRIP